MPIVCTVIEHSIFVYDVDEQVPGNHIIIIVLNTFTFSIPYREHRGNANRLSCITNYTISE